MRPVAMRDANITERVLSIVRTAPTSVASAADDHARSADGHLGALRAAHGQLRFAVAPEVRVLQSTDG